MSGSGPQPTYPSSLFNLYAIAFEGSSIAGILYGVYLALAVVNLITLRKKAYNVLLWFTIAQLVLTTVYMIVGMYSAPAQLLGIFGILSTNTPDALSPWFSVVVNVIFIVNACSSDAFLLCRCYFICMANKYVIAFPALIYLATVSSGVAWLVVSSVPGAVYSTQAVQVAGIIFWSCSVAMNVCASSLISLRLWMNRQAVFQAVGSSQGSIYLRYMEVTLESAMLYTVFVVIAMVVFVLNSPLENMFFPTVGIIQVIAPSLIIYRIVRGIAVKTDKHGVTAASRTSLVSPRPPSHMLMQDTLSATEVIDVASADGCQRQDASLFVLEATKEDV